MLRPLPFLFVVVLMLGCDSKPDSFEISTLSEFEECEVHGDKLEVVEGFSYDLGVPVNFPLSRQTFVVVFGDSFPNRRSILFAELPTDGWARPKEIFECKTCTRTFDAEYANYVKRSFEDREAEYKDHLQKEAEKIESGGDPDSIQGR